MICKRCHVKKACFSVIGRDSIVEYYCEECLSYLLNYIKVHIDNNTGIEEELYED